MGLNMGSALSFREIGSHANGDLPSGSSFGLHGLGQLNAPARAFLDVEPLPTGPSLRVRVDGKFLRLGEGKFWVKGVTYGPFAPAGPDQIQLPLEPQLDADLRLIRGLGANTVRVYHVPPRRFLDAAQRFGLKVLVDVPWPKHRRFLENPSDQQDARRAVRQASRTCREHPALLGLSVVNEIPPDVARWLGPARVQGFIEELVDVAHQEDPEALVTFASFPPTEYLRPDSIDFLTFNVYLHARRELRAYLQRLQNLADEKPLILGEYGIDSLRHGEEEQAELLAMHLEEAFRAGLAGTCVFSFTDEWFTGGHPINDWAFGLVRRDRSPKPAFHQVARVFRGDPRPPLPDQPKVSVVVCTYNGSKTLDGALRSLTRLDYPDFELILVDDGSTDSVPEIAARYPSVRYRRQPNQGLSVARNVGMEMAKGEIIAYTDDDCFTDEDWLYYLVDKLIETGAVGVGGPNLLPTDDGPIAACVQASPGAPAHILIDDTIAEHVPGCNMAFRTDRLRAIGGFDPVYRKAGDDVDVCWRLQAQGGVIAYAPAAMVWHRRRSTVSAYLKQQRGYGEAEALLKRKHPDKFHGFRIDMSWMGRIYTRAGLGLEVGEPAIHHGVFGSGLFQAIYAPPQVWWPLLALGLEWWLLACTILGLAPVFHPAAALARAGWLGSWAFSPLANPLLVLPVLMLLSTLGLAFRLSGQARPREHQRRWWSRLLIAAMHIAQPVERGFARYRARFQTLSLPDGIADLRRIRERRNAAILDRDRLELWSETGVGRDRLLARLVELSRRNDWFLRVDPGWSSHDVRFYGDRWCKADVATVTENHGSGQRLTAVRLRLQATLFGKLLLAAMGFALIWAFGVEPLWSLALCPVVGFGYWRFLSSVRRLRASVMACVLAVAEDLGMTTVGVSPPVPVFGRRPALTQPEPSLVPVHAMSRVGQVRA